MEQMASTPEDLYQVCRRHLLKAQLHAVANPR